LRTPTTTPASAPSELSITSDGVARNLVRAGPSLDGWIYRATDRPECYRRLPAGSLGIERRAAYDEVGRHQAETAVALPAGLLEPEEDRGHVLIRYAVPGVASTLAEALADDRPAVRARAVLAAWRAAPEWWRRQDGPTLPLPAEIALDGDGRAVLLVGPVEPLRPDPFLTVPECAFFLPPEAARGMGITAAREDALRFVLGVALLHCLYTFTDATDYETLLEAAAAGELYGRHLRRDALPFWLLRVPTTAVVADIARRSVAVAPESRRAVDVAHSCEVIEEWVGLMDPLAAAARLREFGHNEEALALLQNTLLTQESYEMLRLAGHIAGSGLGQYLEAIDLQERAIALAPGRPEAMRDQFVTIAAVRHHAGMEALFQRESLATQMDERIQRDYARLEQPGQPRSDAEVTEMAEYLLWRGEHEKAARFIYPLLFDNGVFAWWRFELNLTYARALMRKGSFGDAASQIRLLRRHLDQAQADGTMSVDEYGQRCGEVARCQAELEVLRSLAGEAP
jgi:tetratricopeptide (TPR) repeat protein